MEKEGGSSENTNSCKHMQNTDDDSYCGSLQISNSDDCTRLIFLFAHKIDQWWSLLLSFVLYNRNREFGNQSLERNSLSDGNDSVTYSGRACSLLETEILEMKENKEQL